MPRRRCPGLRVGLLSRTGCAASPATDVDRAALDLVKKLGMTTKEVSLPNWPYGSLMPICSSARRRLRSRSWRSANGVDQLKVAGAGRLAEPVPQVAISLRRGLRPGRSAAPPRRRRDGAHLRRGGPAARPVDCARRCSRSATSPATLRSRSAPVSCEVARGAQRLGARSGEPAADVLAAAACAARRDARSAASSTKGRSAASAWRWSGRWASSANGPRGSDLSSASTRMLL